MMKNVEVARIFLELADLLEFKGEDYFKVRAYRRAGRALSGLSQPIEELWKKGEIVSIPGVGKNIASKIEEILSTGTLKKYEELLKTTPRSLLSIMSLPGIGPKRASLIYERLGISTVEELASAAKEGRLRQLPGIGAKVEKEILHSIEKGGQREGRLLLATAAELAGDVISFLKARPEVKRAEEGGSLRRRCETVGDIDLVVAGEDAGKLAAAMLSHPQVERVIEEGSGWAKFGTAWGVELHVEFASEEDFWEVLFKNTGSKAHLKKLSSLSGRKQKERQPEGQKAGSEEEIYARLGLPYIPPELREDRGEVEAAREGRLPQLVELYDIRGDLHIHSNWSDGLLSLEQVVSRSLEKGYEYAAVTDHSRSLKVAGGLSEERLWEQHEKIRELNKELKGFKLFTGIEVDILPKGGLDFPDAVLKETDVVVASVHSAFKQDGETMTKRLISAIENKNVNIIGHLTGRLIGQRKGYDLDVERVLEAAASCGVALEINASPDRLDLSDVHARRAAELGIKMCISTDAHTMRGMDDIVYGVYTARRAWLIPRDVLNTMPATKVERFLRAKK